jgi:striatin 1/3/4
MAWQSLSGVGGAGNGGSGGEAQQQANQPQGTEYTLQGMRPVRYSLEYMEDADGL